MQQPYETGGSPATAGAEPPPPVEKLKAERVQSALAALPRWALEEDGTAFSRNYRFKTPAAAQAFAAFLGALSAEVGGYPVLTILKSSVFCRVTSTEVAGLTEKEVELARRISLLD